MLFLFRNFYSPASRSFSGFNPGIIQINTEPMGGIEPPTSSLPRKCSTTELQRLVGAGAHSGDKKSGRPGSNRPPSAWKADALPNELLPLLCQK